MAISLIELQSHATLSKQHKDYVCQFAAYLLNIGEGLIDLTCVVWESDQTGDVGIHVDGIQWYFVDSEGVCYIEDNSTGFTEAIGHLDTESNTLMLL